MFGFREKKKALLRSALEHTFICGVRWAEGVTDAQIREETRLSWKEKLGMQQRTFILRKTGSKVTLCLSRIPTLPALLVNMSMQARQEIRSQPEAQKKVAEIMDTVRWREVLKEEGPADDWKP